MNLEEALKDVPGFIAGLVQQGVQQPVEERSQNDVVQDRALGLPCAAGGIVNRHFIPAPYFGQRGSGFVLLPQSAAGFIRHGIDRLGVRGDEAQALRRPIRVRRYRYAARVEDAQQAADRVRAVSHAEKHPVALFDAR